MMQGEHLNLRERDQPVNRIYVDVSGSKRHLCITQNIAHYIKNYTDSTHLSLRLWQWAEVLLL